ncbi:helix-turn-helix domain-containing protein [Ectobacillus sp. JY-23]|uniref:helix-turn-helix domain-containing protein n=1 Tax=Ectobacillus sp. JY-23 TaxID=2933872 RepID=UPI001FF20629|nr:helix-turn-helix domain-containing protein [Ectobacillus sp. JY-23]UOY94184.1 helix-turn-helix domain-containing protein [Ectobacillus sp. JY-23]
MVRKLGKKELKQMVEFEKKESYLLMPNNLFEILSKDEELMRVKAPHVAIAYTYIYFITWLYRYAKYGVMDLDNVTERKIKYILGLSETNKEINYIIKKNGVLDRLGITKTVSFLEAPVRWYFYEEDTSCPQWVYFEEMNRSLKDIDKHTNVKKRKIKEPLFATSEREVNDSIYNGTFYNKEYTHQIPFEVFIECVTNPNLGCTAFYIYGYLASRCALNGGYIEVSVETISKRTGIKPTTRDKVLDALKKFGLIGCSPEDFVIERGEHKTDANTYWVHRDASRFTTTPINYQKRKVIHSSRLQDNEN